MRDGEDTPDWFPGAFFEGGMARSRNAPLSENPFEYGLWAWKSWNAGWADMDQGYNSTDFDKFQEALSRRNCTMATDSVKMMISAAVTMSGIAIVFADGAEGTIPFAALGGDLELSNPYMATLNIPWDFARHYCDPAYKSAIEARD